ncbi:hypothetical protein PSSHI_32920 [Photobacterium sp. R1]
MYLYKLKAIPGTEADQNILWKSYSVKNCRFMQSYLNEDMDECMKKQRFYDVELNL